MGQVLHGSATTTEAVRRAIQHSQESLRALARRYGINQKTVAKWKKRGSTSDLRTGPKEPRSTILTIEEEAVVVAFRRHTLLPLDDCLYALQATIPHLTRSRFTVVSSGTASAGCLKSTATSPSGRSSRRIRSATSTSILPKCGPSRTSSTCWWRSTERPSSRLWNCTRKPPAGSLVTSCGTWPQPCRIGSKPCLPTMARTSPSRPAMAGRPRISSKCAHRSCRSVATPLN